MVAMPADVGILLQCRKRAEAMAADDKSSVFA
jgi:hypothetical protein